MKEVKIILTVSMTVECTDTANTSPADFSGDVKEMRKYIANHLQDDLLGKWQYTTRVKKVAIK